MEYLCEQHNNRGYRNAMQFSLPLLILLARNPSSRCERLSPTPLLNRLYHQDDPRWHSFNHFPQRFGHNSGLVLDEESYQSATMPIVYIHGPGGSITLDSFAAT